MAALSVQKRSGGILRRICDACARSCSSARSREFADTPPTTASDGIPVYRMAMRALSTKTVTIASW